MYNVLPTLKKSSSRCHCNHTSSLMQLTLTDCSLKQMWGRSTPALLNQSHLYMSPVMINIIFVSFLKPSLSSQMKYKQGLVRGFICISCQLVATMNTEEHKLLTKEASYEAPLTETQSFCSLVILLIGSVCISFQELVRFSSFSCFSP